MLGLLVVVAVLAPWIAPHDPESIDSARLLVGPTLRHPFGTDALGRDVLSRLLYAFRVSLLVSAGSIAIAAAVGIPIGLLAGYAGGRVDLVLMRTVELILVLPALLLAISLIAVFGTGTSITVIAIAVIFFPILARVMRSSAQVVSTLPFVDASRARGMGGTRIAVRHVLPNSIGPVVVQARGADGLLDADRGGAVVPRARHAAADAEPRWDALRGARHARPGAVGGDLPGSRDRRHRDRLQPRRRRAAPSHRPRRRRVIDGGRRSASAATRRPIAPCSRSTRCRCATERRGQVSAVDDVTFAVGRAELLGLVGESGCGKSTVAAAILGLLPVNAEVAGSIRYDGSS